MINLETLTSAAPSGRTRLAFACPNDAEPLYWDETGGRCTKCGSSCDRIGEIPLFGVDASAALQVSDEAKTLLDEAEVLGWERALRKRVPPAELESGRADWRFLLPLSSKSRVLEIGTGWGTVASELAAEVQIVAASTPDPARARFVELRARQSGLDNLVPLVAPSDLLPFARESFDLVVLNGDLDRIVGAERRGRRARHLELLRKVSNRLARGGRLYFGAKNRYGADRLSRPWRSLGRVVKRIREEKASSYGLDSLRRLLHDAGFVHADFYATIPSFRHPKKLLPLGKPAVCDFFVGELTQSSAHPGLRNFLARGAFDSGLLPRLMPQFGIVARKGPR